MQRKNHQKKAVVHPRFTVDISRDAGDSLETLVCISYIISNTFNLLLRCFHYLSMCQLFAAAVLFMQPDLIQKVFHNRVYSGRVCIWVY